MEWDSASSCELHKHAGGGIPCAQPEVSTTEMAACKLLVCAPIIIPGNGGWKSIAWQHLLPFEDTEVQGMCQCLLALMEQL